MFWRLGGGVGAAVVAGAAVAGGYESTRLRFTASRLGLLKGAGAPSAPRGPL